MIPDFEFLKTRVVLWEGSQLCGPGPHSWSFAIPLPETIRVGSIDYPLPPSYDNKARIRYEVEVVVVRRGASLFSRAPDVTFVIAPFGIRRRYSETDVYGNDGHRSISTEVRYATAGGFGLSSRGEQNGPTSISASTVEDNLALRNGWNTSTFSIEGLRFRFAIAHQPVYAPGTTISFCISLPGHSNSDSKLLSQLLLPSNWKIELVQCTLLGGTAIRGTLDRFEEDGRSIFVTSVSKGIIQTMESGNQCGEMNLRGEIQVSAEVVASFRFSMVAVYYAIRVSPKIASYKQRTIQPHHVGIAIAGWRYMENLEEPAPAYGTEG